MTEPANEGKFESLEAVRAICALLVLFSHLLTKIQDMPPLPALQLLTNHVTEAVIMFFVLSGVVISMRPYPSLGQYLGARARRIFPTYYLTLLLAVAVLPAAGWPIHRRELWGNLFFLQSMEGFLVSPLKTNIPTWSLSYEVFFYLLYVFLILRPHLLWPLFTASVAAGTLSYFIDLPGGVVRHFWTLFSLYCCWLMGVATVRWWQRGRYVSMADGVFLLCAGLTIGKVYLSINHYDFFRLFWVASGAGFFCSALLGKERTAPGAPIHMPLRLPLPARALVAGAALTLLWSVSGSLRSTKLSLSLLLALVTLNSQWLVTLAGRALRPIQPTLVFVGGVSYALYLVHYPLIILANHVGFRHLPGLNALLVVVLSFLAAYVLDGWLLARIKARRGVPSPLPPTAVTVPSGQLR